MTGLRWLWRERIVRRMAMLTGDMNLVEASGSLAAGVTAHQMGASAVEVGLIFSAAGIGGVWGPWVGGRIQRRFSFGQVIIGVVLLQAVLYPLFAACPSPLWLGVAYRIIEFLGPVHNVVQFSNRIALIPQGLEGSVNAGYHFIAHALSPAGAALCGVLIERLGAGHTLSFFDSVFALLGLAALSYRPIRRESALAERLVWRSPR